MAIVTAEALQAAAAVIEAGAPIHADASPFPGRCVYCLADVDTNPFSLEAPEEHKVDCVWDRLRRVLEER